MSAAARPAAGGSRPLALLAALAATLIWGGWFPISRVAVSGGALTPWDFAMLRCGVAAVILSPVAWRHGLRAGRLGWRGSLGMAATVGTLFPLLLGTGLQHAPSAHAAIFVPGTFPAITFVLGVVLLGDRVTARPLLGVALILAGVGTIGWQAFHASAPGELRGYAMFHVCAWLWASYTIITRRSGLSSLHATAVLNVTATLVLLPVYLLVGHSNLGSLPMAQLLFQATYHGVFGGCVSMLLYNYAVSVLGAAEAAVFGGLVPCFAAILAVPIAGEPIGWTEVAALVTVTAGIVLVTGARLPWPRRVASPEAMVDR